MLIMEFQFKLVVVGKLLVCVCVCVGEEREGDGNGQLVCEICKKKKN